MYSLIEGPQQGRTRLTAQTVRDTSLLMPATWPKRQRTVHYGHFAQWKSLLYEDLNELYRLNVTRLIRSRMRRRISHVMRSGECRINKFFLWKPKGKPPFGRPRRRGSQKNDRSRMRRKISHVMRSGEWRSNKFSYGNLKENHHLEDLGVEGVRKMPY